MLLLHVLQGPDRGTKFELPDNEPQLIGRSSEALPISDSTVSRRHAELTPDDGAWYVRDLESANGTFINGQAISDRHKLQPGDQIRCGSTIFAFAVKADKRRNSPIELLPDETFDVNVESSSRGVDGVVRSEGSGETSAATAIGLRSGTAGTGAEAGHSDPMRTAMQHLRVIYELATVTSGALERDEMLGRVMDLIFQQFQPDRGFILLQQEPDGPTDPAAVRYRNRPRTTDEGRIPVSRTIVQHVMERGEGILSTNAMNDSRFAAGDSVQSYGIRSAICAPIRTRDRMFGVIHIDSQLADFSFSKPQLQLLSAIGQYLGLAMANIELVSSRVQSERLAAVGEAIASLSHSIKNILQGLRGGADALELAINRGDLELAKQGWPILSRNLDRIFNLTLNMLTYSRKPTLDIELESLQALVHEVEELIHPQCDARRVGLILELDEDMPPVPIDSSAMHQALMNLLSNALEAAPAKTGIITVTTRFDSAAHEAHIIVSDNGSGIAEDVQARAFEPFVSTKGQRGTGLGLAVTRKIVEEHGGNITLESSHEIGTSVTITLPSDMRDTDASETHLPRPRASTELSDDF